MNFPSENIFHQPTLPIPPTKKARALEKTKIIIQHLLDLLTSAYLESTEIIYISASSGTLRDIKNVTSHQMFHYWLQTSLEKYHGGFLSLSDLFQI